MHTTTRLLASVAGLPLALGGLLAPASAGGAIPGCGNADLTASYRHGDDGMGHSYGWIVLRNTSGHACRTGGYPGVSYVGDGDGTQIGSAAVRDPGKVATYVLQPGRRLRSPLDEVTALNYPRSVCRRAHVDGLRVYVPDATLAQYVVHPTTGCRNHRVRLLHVSPLRRP